MDNMTQKAVIEMDLPPSCREYRIVFMHEVEDSPLPYCYDCGYLRRGRYRVYRPQT